MPRSPVLDPSPGLWDIRALMVALTGFSVFLNVYATQALLPMLRGVFSATPFKVSLTVSATTIGIALAAPAVGLLAERIGRRRTMIGSLALLTAPTLLAATSPSLEALIGWRLAQGLVMPGIIAVTLAYVSEEWAGRGAAAVMSAYVAGNVLGGVCGRLVSALIAEHVGWRTVFLVLGLVNAGGAMAVWRFLPRPHGAAPITGLRRAIKDMRRHLRRPLLLATFGVGMTSLFALVACFTYITFHLSAPPFALGTAALGFLFLVYLVGVVVTPVAGHWIERLGHKSALLGATAVCAGGVLLTLIPHLGAVLAGLAACSTGVFVCQSSAASYVGRVAGRGRASAAGLYTTFYYGGGTLGASLPSVAWKFGGWTACVLMIVGVLAVGAALAVLFWRPAGHVEVAAESEAMGGG